MTARDKSLQILVNGQSEERGKRQFPPTAEALGAPTKSLRGCPSGDPLEPNGFNPFPTSGFYGSQWPPVAQAMWDLKRYWMQFNTFAVGATSWVEHWCGDPSGIGTGVPYAFGDAGFDPQGYIANTVAQSQLGRFDERWVFMANGQRDGSNNTSDANYQLAMTNMIDYYLSLGLKVILGFSRYHSAWSTTIGSPAVASVVASYASNPNVIAGADLTVTLGSLHSSRK